MTEDARLTVRLQVPQEAIVELTQELVRIPSQGGIDDPHPVAKSVMGWLEERDLRPVELRDASQNLVAVLTQLGNPEGPTYCLNACLDTAPMGDKGAWKRSPLAAEIRNGWLYGRGTADCKVAAAMFCHIAAELANRRDQLKGNLAVLFDLDEHTGRFGGVKAFIEQSGEVEGVMIGYPGNYGVVVGARGFWRAHVTVYGTSAHSGARKKATGNAILKAAALVQELAEIDLPNEENPDFAFGPKLTTTEIRGGNGYSTVPDICRIRIDIRLTPSVSAESVDRLVKQVCRRIDSEYPTRMGTRFEVEESWPPYRLSSDSRIVKALQRNASNALAREIPAVVAGPSNIGNLLAAHSIEATCGFGVTYQNLHAADEAIEVASIAPVFKAYSGAVADLLL